MFSVRKDHLLVLVVGVVCSLGVATADAALIIDFRLDVGGGKAGTVTAVGNTFLVDVYGMITGGSGGSTDGLQTLTASFLSSNAGVILGDISGATRVSPFDSGGSKVGVQAKLDADTDWDWGSTVSLSSTGWFVGRAALQNGPEFKVGTFTFTVTSLDAAAGSINLFPTLRDNTTAYIWREAGTAKNKGNGTVLAGDPIVLNWAGSGAPNMANSITSISKNVLLNASLATVDTTVTITNSGNLAGTPGLSNGGSATHTALSPSGAIASGGGTATTVVSIASTGTYGTVNGSVLATTTGDTSSGNDTTSISVNVGNATASDTGAFVSGNRLSAAVAANGSYANLASKVTAGSGRLATSEAIILAGTAGGTARDVGMNWRTRTGNEASGGVLPPGRGAS